MSSSLRPRRGAASLQWWLSVGLLAVGGLCSLAQPCRADDSNEAAPLLRYRAPRGPHYVRLALEEVVLVGAGFGQYWYDREQNSRDWQFSYDWESFRARLEGKAYAFDTNGFDTNFVFHPAAGTLYYLTARSNRFGPFESLAIAFGTSPSSCDAAKSSALPALSAPDAPSWH